MESDEEIFCGPVTEKEKAVSQNFEVTTNPAQRSYADGDIDSSEVYLGILPSGVLLQESEMFGSRSDKDIKETVASNDLNSSEVHLGTLPSGELSQEPEEFGSDSDEEVEEIHASNEDLNSSEVHLGTLPSGELVQESEEFGSDSDEETEEIVAANEDLNSSEFHLGTLPTGEHYAPFVLMDNASDVVTSNVDQRCENYFYSQKCEMLSSDIDVSGIIAHEDLNSSLDHHVGSKQVVNLHSVVTENIISNLVTSDRCGIEGNLSYYASSETVISCEKYESISWAGHSGTNCDQQDDQTKIIDMLSSQPECSGEGELVKGMPQLMCRSDQWSKLDPCAPRIQEESDSVLISPVSSANGSPACMNTTLDAVDMLLKHGVDYMMCPDDSALPEQGIEKPEGNKVEEQMEEQEEEQMKEQSGTHIVEFKTPCKSTVFPRVGGGKIQHIKYAKSAEMPLKPISTRQNYRNVVSPVATYIKNKPPPSLFQTVRASKSKKLLPGVMSKLGRSPQGTKKADNDNDGNVQDENEMLKPVLPIVTYEKAPGINMNAMGPSTSRVIKGSSTGIKLTKHTGRAVLGSIPENYAQDFTNPEVSLLYSKDVSRSNTLNK